MVSYEKRLLSPHYRAQRLFASAQRMAKKKKLSFDLDVDWIEKKLIAGGCEVSGLPFSLKSMQTGRGGIGSENPFSPSLDRTNPRRGFLKSNTKVVLIMYGQGKQMHSHETFMQLCRALVRKEINKADGSELSPTVA